MINLSVAGSNLLTISNNIHENMLSLRIDHSSSKGGIIKKNGRVRKFLYTLFRERETHKRELNAFINETVTAISQASRDQLVTTQNNEATALFLAAQKYNQTLERTKSCDHTLAGNLDKRD